MLFGDPAHERIALNQDTIWGGGPHHTKLSRKPLTACSRRVASCSPATISRLKKFLRGKSESYARESIRQNSIFYQPVGDLLLDFTVTENCLRYRRKLFILLANCVLLVVDQFANTPGERVYAHVRTKSQVAIKDGSLTISQR